MVSTGRVPSIVRLVIGAMSVVAIAVPVSADISTREFSIHDIADRMIDRCLQYAAAKHLQPLSVAVVDESGTLVSFRRQLGAGALTADAALLKAQTAVRARDSTEALAKLTDDPTVRDAFIIMKLTTLAGGIPLLRTDSSVRGAVGVSGAEVAQDADCAREAVKEATAPLTSQEARDHAKKQ